MKWMSLLIEGIYKDKEMAWKNVVDTFSEGQ